MPFLIFCPCPLSVDKYLWTKAADNIPDSRFYSVGNEPQCLIFSSVFFFVVTLLHKLLHFGKDNLSCHLKDRRFSDFKITLQRDLIWDERISSYFNSFLIFPSSTIQFSKCTNDCVISFIYERKSNKWKTFLSPFLPSHVRSI